jgi:hypothetical protein
LAASGDKANELESTEFRCGAALHLTGIADLPIGPGVVLGIRTIQPGLAPSEQVVAIALRHTFPEFLATAAKTVILVKFLRDRLDLSRAEGTTLAA